MRSSSKKHLGVEELFRISEKGVSIQLLNEKRQLTNKITGWKVKVLDITNENFNRGEIYVLKKDSLAAIRELKAKKYRSFLKKLGKSGIPCLISFSNHARFFDILSDIDEFIPVFITQEDQDGLIFYLESYLRRRLSPFLTVHGVLVDIHRLGVLIIGKSGVGKSESALDLINKGSKLVSDDVIEIRKTGSRLIGTGPDNIKFLMEIRGVGIVNIKDLFGASSVMNEREIDLVIELDPWDEEKEYDRLGIDTNTYRIGGVDIPYLIIPVSPGRNTSTIIDVAVRNQLLKSNRFHKKEFNDIQTGSGSKPDQ